ncbi:F-box/FBD/LRR-repeat protein At1g13570 [Daucus carota subsp. sativus]|uniref:F-box/FBD/LRR-repeat protein At1g13570 n=1 Tax=Daucus carota subsp. sativus TaxID=79200 RepID=UPI0030831C4C
MAESSMKKIRRLRQDRISELPLKIKQIILCLLPIQDAVRTSVLSRKWRLCWTTMPNVTFDDQFSIWYKLEEYCYDRRVVTIRLVTVVNKVLLMHSGSILKFTLMLPRSQLCDGQIIYEFIDQWIPLLSRKGIKQLIVEEDYEFQETMAHDFSSLDLTHLRLTNVLFPYKPALGGFANLVNLELVHVTSNFGKSIFDCPGLEKLALILCEGLFPMNFRAPNLKCLHQVYDKLNLDYALAGLENLTEYSCMFLRSLLMPPETPNVVKVLGSLHKIEKFSSGREYLKYLAAGGCPNRLAQPLPYLNTLNICEMNFADLSEVFCLLCLIQSAPNLCNLHISHSECYHYEDEVCGCDDEGDLKNYWIKDSEDCTIDHLEIVTFSDFLGLRSEFELVKFLLGHSPMLNTMSIHRSIYIKEDVALTMAEEIMQYSRASSTAEIRYLDDPVIIDDFDNELWTYLFDI